MHCVYPWGLTNTLDAFPSLWDLCPIALEFKNSTGYLQGRGQTFCLYVCVLKCYFHMCLCSYLYCLWHNNSSTRFWFCFPIIWQRKYIRVYVNGANLVSQCSSLSLGVYVSVRESRCVHGCAQVRVTNFPSHPVLLRRNQPWLVLQHPEKDKWRGQQAAGEHLSSSAQQMGEAGQRDCSGVYFLVKRQRLNSS